MTRNKPYKAAIAAAFILSAALTLQGCQKDDPDEVLPEEPEPVEPAEPVVRFDMDAIPTTLDGRAVLGSPGNRDIYLWGGEEDTLMFYREFYTGVKSMYSDVVFTFVDGTTGRVRLKASGIGTVPLVLTADRPERNDTIRCHVRNFYGSSWITAENEEICPGVSTTLDNTRYMNVLDGTAKAAIADSLAHGLFCDTRSRYRFFDGSMTRTIFLGGLDTKTEKYYYSWNEQTQKLKLVRGRETLEYGCEVLYNHGPYLRIALVRDETAVWDAAFPDALVTKVVSAQYLDRIDLKGQ